MKTDNCIDRFCAPLRAFVRDAVQAYVIDGKSAAAHEALRYVTNRHPSAFAIAARGVDHSSACESPNKTTVKEDATDPNVQETGLASVAPIKQPC